MARARTAARGGARPKNSRSVQGSGFVSFPWSRRKGHGSRRKGESQRSARCSALQNQILQVMCKTVSVRRASLLGCRSIWGSARADESGDTVSLRYKYIFQNKSGAAHAHGRMCNASGGRHDSRARGGRLSLRRPIPRIGVGRGRQTNKFGATKTTKFRAHKNPEQLEPDSLTLRALPSSGATHTRRCGPGLRPRPLIIIFPPTSAHEIASVADRSTGRAAEAVLLTLSSGGGAAEGRHPTQPYPANLCLLDAPPHFEAAG